MKRYIRIISLILVTVMACGILTGCNGLEEMRSTTGHWTDKGNILLNGEEYILLPENELLWPVISDYNDYIAVTEEDVPMLISPFVTSHEYYISDDGVFLEAYADEIYEECTYYCRKDRYDEVSARLASEFVPDGYCYTYYNYDDSTDKVYTLTKEEVEAVATVINKVEPSVVPSVADIYYDYSIYLYECSADLMLRRYAFDICTSNGEYCILTQHDGEDTIVYQVPDEYKATFESLCKAYINAEDYWSDEYYYEEEYYA